MKFLTHGATFSQLAYKLTALTFCSLLFSETVLATDDDEALAPPVETAIFSASTPHTSASSIISQAQSIDLNDVVDSAGTSVFPPPNDTAQSNGINETDASKTGAVVSIDVQLSAESNGKIPNIMRHILDVDIPPGTTTRVNWSASRSFAGMAADTPVLVVNGAWDGPTLCLTAAVHGDELNGIEMVRRVLYNLDPQKLHGTVIGVPIVNLLGFSRNSRYLPDRRDLNRYFPGNAHGSVASRLAHTFFNDIIKHCNALVDLHTGSFYRTNITQLRADLSVPDVADFTALFGDIPVLNSHGHRHSLRAAAVRAGIPSVTIEAGEPMRMQSEVVEEGVTAINTLMEKNGMYPSFSLWAKAGPAFYRSVWQRANASGILFSQVKLGENVDKGDVLGQVINPISNEKTPIIAKYQGRVLGMALDQFVLPGFATYHIGIKERDAKKLIQAIQTEAIDNAQLHNNSDPDKASSSESNIVTPGSEDIFDD